MTTIEVKRITPWALTDRQKEVVELIERGLSNNEIAAELLISPRTVKMHTDTIRGRFGISRRSYIVPALREQGLID